MSIHQRFTYLSAIAVFAFTTNLSAQVSITTHHNDNARTGQNISEFALTPANVNANTFGKLFSHPLDGSVYAQPLYVPNVNIPNQGVHNVAYVATEHNTVYAFDADDVSETNASPLWQVSFIDPANNITPVPSSDIACPDLVPEIGITGTPVIDPATGTMYLVARTKENGNYIEKLHALDITTGTETLSGPVTIQASVAGSGEGSQNGVVSFNSYTQNQRAALLLQNGIIYIGFGSLCDIGPYHGWVLAYSAQNLAQVGVWNSSPNGSDGGIWMGGAGLVADANFNLFFSTSNGTFDANLGGSDLGDSVVKLPQPPQPQTNPWQVSDFFTPYNQAILDRYNTDLGSGGVLLLPDQPAGSPHQHLLVTAGKQGTIYLIDRDHLGGFNPINNKQIVQVLPNAMPGVLGMGAWWNNSVYFSSRSDVVKAWSFNPTTGLLSTAVTSHSTVSHPYALGSIPVISANGNTNGILWTLENAGGKAILHAYDAANLTNELYNTTQNAPRDLAGIGVRFMVPVVANGKVYVAASGQLSVYGLYTVAPTRLTFAKQLAGTVSATSYLTLSNLTSTAMSVASITVSREFAGPTGTCSATGFSLDPGASCTIGVAFAPQGGGTLSGKITISTATSQILVPLTGTGQSVTLSATTFNLGIVPVSQTGTPRSFGVNIIGTDATTFNSVVIGSNSTEYSVFSNDCTGSISGPATCIVKLSFSPTGGGTRTGTLNLSDSSGNQVVKLTALGAAVQLAPTSLAFGIQNVGSTSAPQTVVVSVLGNTAATFGTIALAGNNPADYAIQSDTCSGMSVPGGSTCQFNVVFTPTRGGNRPATLSIPNNGGPTPLHLKVSGTGRALLTSITVNPINPTATPGTTISFTATGAYNDGTSKDITSAAKWTSSNSSVATVSNVSGSKGLATATGPGTSQIGASLNSIATSTTMTVSP
jgi:hypothetical protein